MAASRKDKVHTLKRIIDFADDATVDDLAAACKDVAMRMFPDDDAKWRYFDLSSSDTAPEMCSYHAQMLSDKDYQLPDGSLFATDRKVASSCGFSTYHRTVYLHDHIRREVWEYVDYVRPVVCDDGYLSFNSCRCVQVTKRAYKRRADEATPPPAPALRSD